MDPTPPRYSSKEQGEIAVVVAPVLRFIDVGFNASVKIEVGGGDLGTQRARKSQGGDSVIFCSALTSASY